jgi:transcriptional regulator with XRE-family HTH domain
MENFYAIFDRHLAEGTTPPDAQKRKHWSNKKFAEFCGYSEGAVGNWRRGENLPTPSNAKTIEIALFGNDPEKDTPAYTAWRQEFRAAYELVKIEQNGIERRTSNKWFQENLVPIEPTSIKTQFSKLLVRVPARFMGREQQLAQINALLHSTSGRVSPVILFGMRGVGKTTLAVAYADIHQADYRVVWSISAESAFSTRDGLIALGLRLGWHPDLTDSELAAQIVLDLIAREDRGILLIYDNAVTSKSIAPFLPRGGECHVLITSNSHAWRGVGTPIEVEVWPPKIGARFLIERTGEHSASYAAEQLSVALEGLPLAHEVAAAFCEHTSVSIGDYLASFSTNSITLLNDQRYSPVEYYGGIAVARAFEMAIEAATGMHPACGILISYASYLPTGPIPHCIFILGSRHLGIEYDGTPFSDEEIIEALAVLRSFALVQDSSLSSPYQLGGRRIPQAMQIHRLIRIVAKNYAIKNRIVKDSPNDELIQIVKAAFQRCNFFDPEPNDGRVGNYNILIDYLRLLQLFAEVDGSSIESKQYLADTQEEHVRQCKAWPH